MIAPPAGESRAAPALAVAAAALLAVAVSGVRFAMWMRGKTPLGDYAGTELRLRDIPRRLPLTGPYSRVGWFHPGPIVLWFTRPFEVLFGGPGMFAAAMVLNVAAVALCCWAIVRGWAPAAACGLIALLAAWVVLAFDDFVVDPWNPFTTVLTLLAAALCAVALPAEARLVYALVVAASVAAQSHVACLLPAALLLAVAFWQARSRWRRLLALLLALWIGPVVDLVAGSHNLYHVARDLAGGDGGRFGLAPALRAMAAVFEPRQALSRGWVPIVELGYVDDHPSAAGWVCLAAAVAACAFVAWRGSGSTRRWALIVLIGIVLGVFSLSGAATPVFGHIVEWIDVLPLATVLVGWAWIADRWARHLRPVTLAALAVTSALAIVAGARATTPRRVTSVSADAIPAVARTILARFASAPVVLADDDQYHAGYVVAVANEIERRGGHVKIAGPWGEFGKFGDQRTPSAGNDCLAHLLVVTRRDGSPPPAPGEEVAAIALTDRGAGTMTVSVLSPSTCSR